MVDNEATIEVEQYDAFQEEVASELEQSQRALKEITLMLEQNQIELNKLTQRNTSIVVHLQQVQAQLEGLPRADIRTAYESALDAQQRLFGMRHQLEKLQGDQSHLERYISLLTQTQKMFPGSKPNKKIGSGSSSAALEMLINAQEAERQRLSRKMHDGPAQALSNFILQTEIAMRLFDIDQVRAKDELINLKMAATNTFQKVRNFIFELRPMMLDDLGLVPTVKRYMDTFKEQTSIEVTLSISGTERRLEPYLEVMLFRSLQELMGNAARHSQATQLKVQVNLDDHSVRISVDDNGKGFDPEKIGDSGGIGLKVIKERVDMLGGHLAIDSVLGQGSRVEMDVPAVFAS